MKKLLTLLGFMFVTLTMFSQVRVTYRCPQDGGACLGTQSTPFAVYSISPGHPGTYSVMPQIGCTQQSTGSFIDLHLVWTDRGGNTKDQLVATGYCNTTPNVNGLLLLDASDNTFVYFYPVANGPTATYNITAQFQQVGLQ